jgi:hypothetical protein
MCWLPVVCILTQVLTHRFSNFKCWLFFLVAVLVLLLCSSFKLLWLFCAGVLCCFSPDSPLHLGMFFHSVVEISAWEEWWFLQDGSLSML